MTPLTVRPAARCCSTEQLCEQHRGAPLHNGQKVFIAHPFDPVFTEWAKEVREEIEGYGISAVLPEDDLTTGVVFCKICQQIRGCTAILSEFTALNRNVIFEHGFGLAIGMRGVIAVDKTRRKPSILTNFRDIEWKEYESREEVVLHVATLAENDKLLKEPSANGVPKVLGEWDLDDVATDFDKVCFLRTDQPNRDNVKRITSILRRCPFDVTTVEPEEFQTHRLLDHCRTIKSSFAVVGHYVSSDTIDHEKHNALTALLLGLAVGFGKRILVLQEKPIDKQMIDLGGVLREYKTLGELERILLEKIQEWKQLASVEQDSHKTITSLAETRAAVLRLGTPQAENDDLLAEAFFDTRYFRKAEGAYTFLMAGKKGSGKSAIFQYLGQTYERRPKRRAIFLEFTSLEVQRLREVSDAFNPRPSVQLLLRTFWRANLILDLVDEVLDETPAALKSDPAYLALVQWRESLPIGDEKDYVERFLAAIGASTFEQTYIDAQLLVKTRFPEVEKLLKTLIEGWEIHLYADRLDEGWDSNDPLAKELVVSFVHECHSLLNSLPGIVRPVLFMQEVMLTALKEGVLESDKWEQARIKWSRRDLRQMLEKRLRVAMSSTSDVAWNAILPEEMHGQEAIDYLLDRTFLRPRDAVALLQRVVDEALSVDDLPASESDVARALRFFAEDRLLNLTNEMAAIYPALDQVVEHLGPLFTTDEFTDADEMLIRLRGLPDIPRLAWALDEDAVHALYDASVICLKDEEGKLIWREVLSYEQALGVCAKKERNRQLPVHRLVPLLTKRETYFTPYVRLHPALDGNFDFRRDPVEFRS